MYNSYSALNLLGSMLYTMIFLVIAYFVLKIVANWKIFEKAGQPGWASIVPFYSNYIEFNIYWGNGWLFLIPVVKSRPSQLSKIKIRTMADTIWVVVFLCVLIASCFGMYYFQGENKQKFVFCFLLVALSFGVLAFRLLDIAYTMINVAVKAAQ